MSAPGYVVGSAGTAIAITASTTKSIFGVIAGGKSPIIVELAVTFDSTSATAGKAAVQICQSTQATAGTSTSQTPVQLRGKAQAALASGAINYTAEPTVLTVVKEWFIDVTTPFVIQYPLSREPEADTSGGTVKAWIVRIVPPATGFNVRGYVEFEED